MKEISKMPDKQDGNRDFRGRFKSGYSGNIQGRPKEKTLKEYIREYLKKNPKQLEKIVYYFVNENRELMWQMLEGRPPKAEADKDNPIVEPIIGMQIIYGEDGK